MKSFLTAPCVKGGMLLLIDPTGGMASNLDCCTCPCGANYKSLTVTPSAYALAVGGKENLMATANYSDRWVAHTSFCDVCDAGLIRVSYPANCRAVCRGRQ